MGIKKRKSLDEVLVYPTAIDLGKTLDTRGNRHTVQDPWVGTALMLLVHLKCRSFADDEMIKLDLKTY